MIEKVSVLVNIDFLTTSIIIKITRDQHVNTFTLIGSKLVVMVLRAQRPLATIAQFFHFVAEEKKKDDKKTKAFYDWATTCIPVKKKKRKTIFTSHERSRSHATITFSTWNFLMVEGGKTIFQSYFLETWRS